MSEDFVSYSMMQFFKDNRWMIAQYHPPGGQASFGIRISGEMLYPDLIGCKDSRIVVVENKPRYNAEDIEKLRKMMADPGANGQIVSFVRNFCYTHNIKTYDTFALFWAHGFSGKQIPDPLPDVNLIYIDREGNITVKAASRHPLIV